MALTGRGTLRALICLTFCKCLKSRQPRSPSEPVFRKLFIELCIEVCVSFARKCWKLNTVLKELAGQGHSKDVALLVVHNVIALGVPGDCSLPGWPVALACLMSPPSHLKEALGFSSHSHLPCLPLFLPVPTVHPFISPLQWCRYCIPVGGSGLVCISFLSVFGTDFCSLSFTGDSGLCFPL